MELKIALKQYRKWNLKADVLVNSVHAQKQQWNKLVSIFAGGPHVLTRGI